MRVLTLVTFAVLATVVVAQKPASKPAKPATGKPAATKPATAKPVAGGPEYTLDNGLRVRLVKADTKGQVAVLLALRGGRLSEPSGSEGAAGLAEGVLTWCQPHGSAEKALGLKWQEEGRTRTDSDHPDVLRFQIIPAASEIEGALKTQAMRLFAPINTASLEPAKKWEIEALDQLEQGRRESTDYFDRVGWSAFAQCALHGRATVDLRKTLGSMNSDRLVEHLAGVRVPERALLTIAGDFDEARVRTVIDSHFRQKAPVRSAGSETRPALVAGAYRCNWDMPSHRLFMAWKMPPVADPAHPALVLAASALFMKLTNAFPPDQKTVKGPLVVRSTSSLFVVGIPLYVLAAAESVSAKLRGILDAHAAPGGFEPHELDEYKMVVRTNSGAPGGLSPFEPNPPEFIRSRQEWLRAESLLEWSQTPEEYCARIDKVGAEAIKAAVRTWLAPDKAAIVTIAGKE